MRCHVNEECEGGLFFIMIFRVQREQGDRKLLIHKEA
jgi:hypothetical protein